MMVGFPVLGRGPGAGFGVAVWEVSGVVFVVAGTVAGHSLAGRELKNSHTRTYQNFYRRIIAQG